MDIALQESTLIYLLDFHQIPHDLGAMSKTATEVEDYMATFSVKSLIESGIYTPASPSVKIPLDQGYWWVYDQKNNKKTLSYLRAGSALSLNFSSFSTRCFWLPYEDYLKFSANVLIRVLYILKCQGEVVITQQPSCRFGKELKCYFRRADDLVVVRGWPFTPYKFKEIKVPQILDLKPLGFKSSKENLLRSLRYLFSWTSLIRDDVRNKISPLFFSLGEKTFKGLVELFHDMKFGDLPDCLTVSDDRRKAIPRAFMRISGELFQKLLILQFINLEAMRETPELYIQGDFVSGDLAEALMTYELTPRDVQKVMGITKEEYEEALSWKSKLFQRLMDGSTPPQT